MATMLARFGMLRVLSITNNRLLLALHHSRIEWIGPAVVTYIAKELILGYRNNKKITRLVNQFEFVIVPLLNADGYVYTWETNRMWRKNRQPTSIPFCPGVVS